MSQIKISIIVPVYNSAKYLKRCINSLINQTLKEIEIILINDGSTDDSENIIKSYNDPRIVLISQKNQGQSVARNTGLKYAQGEYIGFVDSDDWIDLNFYEKLYQNANQENADIAVANIVRLHKTNRKYYLKYDKKVITQNADEKFRLCDVPDRCYVWNKIYKANKLKEKELKFKEGIFFEDVIFTPEALFHLEKLVTVPDTNYFYWRRPGSTVTLNTCKAKNDYKYAEKTMKKFLEEHNIDVSFQKTIAKKYSFCGITIFKSIKKAGVKRYTLLGLFKWQRTCS